MATIFETVKNIIIKQLDIEDIEINMETSLIHDLNIDSLELVKLLMAFEEEFLPEDETFGMTDDKMEQFLTVEAIVNFLTEFGIKGCKHSNYARE